ncbi:unnamed protein product, partial [marine sediment metagenome]
KEKTEPTPALAQALLTGMGEAAIEQWTLGRKLGLLKNFRKMVAGGLSKVIWEGTKAFFRGTAEEGTQTFNRNFWQWVFTDRSQAWMANVSESMAAGGPMEMVMAGGFAAAGMVGPAIPTEQKIERIEKIRHSVNTNPDYTSEHKKEINAELDNVVEEVQQGKYDELEAVQEEAVREVAEPITPPPEAPERARIAERPAEPVKVPPKAVEAVPIAEVPKVEEPVPKKVKGRELTEKVSEIQEKAVQIKVTPIEPTKIISPEEAGPFKVVLKGTRLIDEKKFRGKAQTYENKIARLKTQIEQAKADKKMATANALIKQREKTTKLLSETKEKLSALKAIRIKANAEVVAAQKELLNLIETSIPPSAEQARALKLLQKITPEQQPKTNLRNLGAAIVQVGNLTQQIRKRDAISTIKKTEKKLRKKYGLRKNKIGKLRPEFQT